MFKFKKEHEPYFSTMMPPFVRTCHEMTEEISRKRKGFFLKAAKGAGVDFASGRWGVLWMK